MILDMIKNNKTAVQITPSDTNETRIIFDENVDKRISINIEDIPVPENGSTKVSAFR